MQRSSTQSSAHASPLISFLQGPAVFVGALFTFYCLLNIMGRLGLPEWTMPLIPFCVLISAIFLLQPKITLFCWAFLIPLTPFPLVGDDFYFYDVITIFLLALWSIQIYSRKKFEITGADWLVVLVIAAAVLSVWMNTHRFGEVQDLIYKHQHRWLTFPGKLSVLVASFWFPYFMAYFFSSRLANTEKKQKIILIGLFLAVLLNTVWALYNWSINPLGFSRENRTVGFFYEIQDMGYMSAIAVTGVLSAFLYQIGGKRLRSILLIGGFLFFLNLVLNFTRSVYVEFAFAVFLLLILTRSFRILLFFSLVGLFTFVIILNSGIDDKFIVMFTSIGSRKAFGIYARLQTWFEAIRIFREQGGFWGVGLGNFMPYSELIIIMPSLKRYKPASAHGMFWQILAEQGIPGLLIWFLFFISWLGYFYRNFIRSVTSTGKALNLWLFLVVAMYVLDGFFYMEILPPGHSRTSLMAGYLVWILLGLGVSYNRLQKSKLTAVPGES